ncbi:hypothetical protein JL720_10700 [Aureococcus anophagefferens]|nr:hypothetical protein JL720_10700 [Aureococcus anophagefferens]
MGGCQNPGRVFKGKKMAGRMGGRNRTAQNLTVHKIDTVANRKRWYFTVPDYAPFMRPICLGFTAGCRFMMDPRNQSRVPFVEIVTGPGDLLVFPSFWPHAVANLDEGFGFGVGVRPRSPASSSPRRRSRDGAAVPALAALNFALRHAYTAATRPAFYRDAVARLSGKFASLSTSLAVNSPELEAVALRARRVRLHWRGRPQSAGSPDPQRTAARPGAGLPPRRGPAPTRLIRLFG